MFGGAFTLWLGARVLGSPDLHMAAVGLAVLPLLATAVVRLLPHDLAASRRLSARRAFPGSAVRVDVEVRNGGRGPTPLLLLQDALPAGLGRPARAVLGGIPPRERHAVSYEVRCRARGRHLVGPLTAQVGDPFDLARVRLEFPGQDELVVYPVVEDLDLPRLSATAGGGGSSATRQLFRSGEEFYTMRPYELGDDLRRIHWPSTARSGQLMIRQEEAARRSVVTVLLDTRSSALAPGDQFEKAVSAAASVCVAYERAGFSLRLATVDLAPTAVAAEQALEVLALAEPSGGRLLSPALLRLRQGAAAGASLVAVTHPLPPEELVALARGAAGYTHRLAILVYPHHPAALAPAARSDLERRGTAARLTLARAGWDVLLLAPTGRLRDVWAHRATRPVNGRARTVAPS